jgi:hypothetical protein
MIPLKVLEKYGCDAKSLKPKFNVENGKEESPKIKELRQLIRDRVRRGIEYALVNYRTWAAVDLAYDAPFHQQTPTIIRSILNNAKDDKAALDACRSWGLCEGDLFCKVKEGGKDVFRLNAPAVFTTLVPVVRAYMTVRTAKIFNDRNLTPLLKYEPITSTAKNKARCQLLTNLVQKMTATMGYPTTLQRLIFNPLMYSVGLMFPEEPWYKETQEDVDGKEVCVRQGVRYVLPHITRTFYDLNYPVASFNTDTGCSYGGYFTIQRYRDVVNNKAFWNKERITYGFDWTSPTGAYNNYFTQAYPCTEMAFPIPGNMSKETDRETASNFYQYGDLDKNIFVTPLFMKLIPKDWDMGTYDKPVWFRFFVAADDTVLYCEPYPYRPITVSQYDPDQNRAKNASLALEIIPSQDMLGNLLTQIVLTIKRNLANIQFYDVNMNIGEQLEQFQKRNQWQYESLNFIGYDSLKQKIGNVPDPSRAFHSITFPFADTSQMLSAISTVISMLERLLVISPQEIGASASHQQSKAEVVIINSNTTNRVAYTASFIDEAIDAWKASLYEALVTYGDAEEFIAELSSEIPNIEQVIKDLGLSKEEDLPDRRRILVKGKYSALRLEGFASTRDGPDRGNDAQAAQAQSMAITSINQNPMVAQIVDPESVLEAIEETAKLNGAPDDFKMRTNKAALQQQRVESQVAQMAQQIQQGAVEAAVNQVIEQVAKPAAAAVQQQSEQIAEVGQQVADIAANMEKLQQIVMATVQAPPLATPDQSTLPIEPAPAMTNEPVLV